jgi:hypothetical protein
MSDECDCQLSISRPSHSLTSFRRKVGIPEITNATTVRHVVYRIVISVLPVTRQVSLPQLSYPWVREINQIANLKNSRCDGLSDNIIPVQCAGHQETRATKSMRITVNRR